MREGRRWRTGIIINERGREGILASERKDRRTEGAEVDGNDEMFITNMVDRGESGSKEMMIPLMVRFLDFLN